MDFKYHSITSSSHLPQLKIPMVEVESYAYIFSKSSRNHLHARFNHESYNGANNRKRLSLSNQLNRNDECQASRSPALITLYHDCLTIKRSKDRSILIWSCSNLEDGKNRKSFRINVEYDSGTRLAWHPDDRTIAIHKLAENCIEFYKMDRKDNWFIRPSKGICYPKVTHESMVGFGISCTGRFMMSCDNSTNLYVWDLKGNQLDTIDTYLMSTFSAKISPCGRFIAACGFAPDCKVWEVKFSKAGEYQKTIRAFDLTGHSSGLYDVAFDQDTSHMATVSRDGTWKLFYTRIDYEKGQSPRCLITGQYKPRPQPSLIALSINAEVLAIASGTIIELYSTRNGECDARIRHVFEQSIVAITFDPLGKYLFAAGDRYVRMYHNITGYKESNANIELKLKSNLTNATRERLEKQIAENAEFLKKFS